MDEVKIIKKEVESFLEKLGIEAQTSVSQKEDFFEIDIEPEGEEAGDDTGGQTGILIGYHGETLQALQLILALIVSKKIGRFARLILNVGDYREKREEKLREMAVDAARRAKETKQEVILGNLASWQRRIVHMALSEDKDVMTQSQGEEPDRQLVIKPK